MRKHIDKQKMKGWQRRNFDKKNREQKQKQKQNLRKLLHVRKKAFFYQKKRTKDKKILTKSVRKHIDKPKMKGW